MSEGRLEEALGQMTEYVEALQRVMDGTHTGNLPHQKNVFKAIVSNCYRKKTIILNAQMESKKSESEE